jgi:hypothetical protein
MNDALSLAAVRAPAALGEVKLFWLFVADVAAQRAFVH